MAIVDSELSLGLPVDSTDDDSTMSSIPPTPDPCLQVFVDAAKAAAAYASVAAANLRRFAARDKSVPSKFNLLAMEAAWGRSSGNQAMHCVLFSGTQERKLQPFSLDMLWGIHSRIVHFDAVLNSGAVPSDESALQELCRTIQVDSELLRETCNFAARVCAAGIGPQLYRTLSSGQPVSQVPGFTDLSTAYLDAIVTIIANAKAAFPNSPKVSSRVSQFVPLNVPVWVKYGDDSAAKNINHVWFPKDFAEPLMKSLATQQAEAIRQKKSNS